MASDGPSRSEVPVRSPTQSPVPYLFGGLAAMIGLIVFALCILACSYWKLSGHFVNPRGDQGELEAGEGNQLELGKEKAVPAVLEDKILVIMAGHDTPTFLATPASSRASSFNSSTNAETADSVAKGTLRIEEQGV